MSTDLRVVAPAVAGWLTAALLVGPAGPSSRTAVLVAVVALLVAGVAGRRPWLVLLCLVVTVVAASTGWRLATVESSPVSELASEGRVVTAEVTVRRDARVFEGQGRPGVVVGLVVDRVSVDGRTIDVDGRATGFGAGGPAGLTAESWVVGRRGVVRARLAPSDSSDEVAVLRVLRADAPRDAPWWWEGSERVREGIRQGMSAAPAGPRALVPALVDGDDSAVPDDLSEDFRRSGLTHLLAVSGTNLTIVLGAVLVLARLAGVRRRLLWPVGVLAIVGFVCLARPDPSVVRAAAMGAVGLAALGYGSRGGLRALGWAVIALVFLDPWLSRSAGFVLSVSATAGILVLGPSLTTRLAAWLPRWLAVAVAVPTAAQLAVTPALAQLTGEVSLVAVAANLVAGPFVAPTTVLGLLAGLVAVVSVPVGSAIGWAAAAPAAAIIGVGRAASALDGASVAWPGPWWTLLLVTPVAGVALWWTARRPVLLLGLAGGLAVALWRPPDPGWPPPGWSVVSCDVGQGDATVVATGPGEAVVIDTGMEDRPVDRCLSRLGVERVRALVLTHADADHVDGWAGVTTGRQVDLVLVGSSGGPEVPGVPRRPVAAGDAFTVGGVHFQVLWPRPSTTGRQVDADRNDVSVVLSVTVDGTRFLLTGDVGPTAQRALLRSGVDLAADVLKVPHHGSADQDPGFFLATGARVALFSAGRDNTYGHPAPAAVDLVDDHGMSWWRTDRQGDVAVVVHDGELGVRARG
ncbi:DNA internalization competence protein ComEC/Rec2-like protein [Aeromicrobium marinum DSM 15272]|uniref:DNA internalization competence protein ComEC/Rec2-like protein n=1 Tax=Aeromicrobium marinum DSM 15272 TaxID=585531 RepID=E2SB52_9ACTN|nr:ComEC/Rec2 family competence protein [Aeromicrobium marinum]EFQ83598.1 DNA internalization competence protein ComEC/Rec2-like protein [Aeromicrobium marinum DSM 15272]